MRTLEPSRPIRRYTLAARLIHWIMAVGFVFMWLCGYVMSELVEDDSPLQETLVGLHVSVGLTLAALLVIRLVTRWLHPPPPLPPQFPRSERVASRWVHIALYVLPAGTVAAGWLETDLGGHGVAWFGLLEVPQVIPDSEGTEALYEEIHLLLAYGFLALALVHFAAVVKHRWYDRRDVLSRMSLRRLAE